MSDQNSTSEDQEENNDTVLNKSQEDVPNEEAFVRKTTTAHGSQDPVHPYTWEERNIPITVPYTTMSEKYVSSKIVLSPGRKGSRPHFSSICALTIGSMELLSKSFDIIFNHSRFSASEEVSKDFNYQIGSSETELEKALEVALLDMFEGERSQFILHASDRRNKVRDEEVSPTPCLKCILHLKSVVHTAVSSDHQENCLLSLSNLSEERRCNIAIDEKAHGIDLFKKGHYVDAFHRFAWGCKVLMTCDSLLLDDDTFRNKDVLNLYSILCSNMAECQLKENNPTLAVSLCKKAIASQPGNLKALYRQAVASWTLGDVDQAQALLKQVLKLDPNNVAAKHLMKDVEVKIKEYSDKYSKMMKRIFQQY